MSCHSNNLNLLVINPSIHFSWIENNWDEKYKNRAMAEIKALVSAMRPFLLLSKIHMILHPR